MVFAHREVQAPSQSGSIIWLILVSVVLHGLILWLFNRGASIHHVEIPKPVETITARLVFAPPVPELPQALVETPVDPVPPTQAPPPEPELVQESAAPPTQPVEVEPAIEPPVVVAPVEANPIASPLTDKNRRVLSSADLARQHLRGVQLQQEQRLAEQAAKDYQTRKNSPEIETQVKDPFATEEEKLLEKLTIRADCSSATKKTVAAVMGFLGGGVKCTKPPDLSPFIERRINKGVEQKQR